MYEVEVKVAADHGAVRERLPHRATPLGTVEQVDTYFDAPHRDFAATDEALRLRRERRVEAGRGTGGDAGSPDDPGVEASADDRDDADRADAEWTTAVAYKGPLLEAESKSREEFETVVAEGDELEAALERLGFEPAATVRKRRERYALDEFTVSLDAVEGLGEFVEVETEVERDENADESEGAGVDEGADVDRESTVDEEVDVNEESVVSDAIAGPREAARALLSELGCDPEEQVRTSYLGLLLADDR